MDGGTISILTSDRNTQDEDEAAHRALIAKGIPKIGMSHAQVDATAWGKGKLLARNITKEGVFETYSYHDEGVGFGVHRGGFGFIEYLNDKAITIKE